MFWILHLPLFVLICIENVGFVMSRTERSILMKVRSWYLWNLFFMNLTGETILQKINRFPKLTKEIFHVTSCSAIRQKGGILGRLAIFSLRYGWTPVCERWWVFASFVLCSFSLLPFLLHLLNFIYLFFSQPTSFLAFPLPFLFFHLMR